jgi:hypothetical protein
MGTRGPAPKRDAERRRTNERELPTTTVNVAELSSGEVVIPEMDENWHPVAKRLWASFPLSAASVLLEPTDWALLYVGCDDLSRELKPKHVQVGVDGAGDPIFVQRDMPMPGAKLNALLKLMTGLLALEGDRRRLAVEINRAAHGEAGEQVAAADQVAAQRQRRATG